MSKSVLSRPTVTKSQDRNPFDNSCFRNWHQSLGMLIPVFCKAFPAGTKGSFNRFAFTRTKKVLYPAFQGVHECIDVFKVPIRLLWSQWNDWKLNINDLNSSSLVSAAVDGSGNFSADLNQPSMVPRFDFGSNAHARLTGDATLERVPVFTQSLRLLDALRYGQKTVFSDVPNVMSVFKLAAYQKIYYDHYRNTSYESNDPYSYNLDFTYGPSSSDINGVLDVTDNIKSAHCVHQLLTLRHVNLRNDAMHNIYPSLNYVLSQPNGLNWSLPSSVFGSSFSGTSNIGSWTINVPSGSVGEFGPFIQSDTSKPIGMVNPQSIRSLFALDKLMRASAYAPKHVKDQFKARFGVDLPDCVQLHSERLGSFKNDVIFGEVTSMANTSSSGSNLGDVGGKGVGSADWNKTPIPFYCEEDSIIMALHYFTIDAVYDSYCVDEWNTKLAREDFFQPEFQNLGLRPFYRKFLNNTGTLEQQNQILGYTVPNQSYKIEPDLNTGIFNDSFMQVKVDNSVETVSSPLRAFVSHLNYQDSFSVGSGVNWRYFKVYPIMLDSVFQESFDSTNLLTDQFYGHLKFRVPVVEPMSVHGQPSL